MGNKARNSNYEILDKILADSDRAQRQGGRNGSFYGGDDEGTWITSKEQFDQHYKSVEEIEKYLRS